MRNLLKDLSLIEVQRDNSPITAPTKQITFLPKRIKGVSLIDFPPLQPGAANVVCVKPFTMRFI